MSLLQNPEFQLILAICSFIGGASGLLGIYEFLQRRPKTTSVLAFIFAASISGANGLAISFGFSNQPDWFLITSVSLLSFATNLTPALAISLWKHRKIMSSILAVISGWLALNTIIYSYCVAAYFYPYMKLEEVSAKFLFIFFSFLAANLASIGFMTFLSKE